MAYDNRTVVFDAVPYAYGLCLPYVQDQFEVKNEYEGPLCIVLCCPFIGSIWYQFIDIVDKETITYEEKIS